MNLIYDQRTAHSRLMVWIDRQGLSIRQWDDESDIGFNVQTAFYSWARYKDRAHVYSGDDGSGRMKARLVAGAISLLAYWGAGSNGSGEVSSLSEYINGGHVFHC